MAKSNYLPVILFITAVWFYSYFGSNSISNNAYTSSSPNYLHVQNTMSQPDKRYRVQSVYSTEIGVREKSNQNDGHRVEEYLAFTGNKRGEPWCASFVCWTLGQAGAANPRSGWSPHLFPSAKVIWKNSWANRKSLPQKGDVFGIWYNSKGRIAHCGFVDVWGANQVITVEGNTNESGSREGDGVYRKRRLKKSLYAVADWLGRKEEGHEI